jgi:hypothetical protein
MEKQPTQIRDGRKKALTRAENKVLSPSPYLKDM